MFGVCLCPQLLGEYDSLVKDHEGLKVIDLLDFKSRILPHWLIILRSILNNKQSSISLCNRNIYGDIVHFLKISIEKLCVCS